MPLARNFRYLAILLARTLRKLSVWPLLATPKIAHDGDIKTNPVFNMYKE